jgi:hypothetical protein
MPVSIRTANDPFVNQPQPVAAQVKADAGSGGNMRTPHAHILQVLFPERPQDHYIEWPLLTRAQLGIRVGYTAISGTITRALKGVHSAKTVNEQHDGLLDLKYVVEVPIETDVGVEVNYRITAAGIAAYRAYLLTHPNGPPPCKDRSTCVTHFNKKNPAKSRIKSKSANRQT